MLKELHAEREGIDQPILVLEHIAVVGVVVAIAHLRGCRR
jgi:hypothetical protein